MAHIKADEISKILREQIANYEQTVSVDEVGSVISVGDGIARVHGLEKAMYGEMLAFPHDIFGIALNLEEEEVGVVLLGESSELKEGDTVRRTNTIMSVPVGEELVGRVVNPLGNRKTTRARSCLSSALRWSVSPPAFWIVSLSANRCRPELKRLTP